MSRVFVIAEVAGCHDGDLDKALALVKQARDVDADVVKFQYCSNPEKLAQRRHAPEYVSAYQTLRLPLKWLTILRNAADLQNLEFMCTVYLPEDVSVVAPFVSRFKIASFEADDTEFALTHELYDKPVIISLGMNSEGTVLIPEAQYLYCVSGYPTPLDQINLARMYEGFDGLSDHTTHPLTGALATATGADIIEFHMRLNHTDKNNPDYKVSRDPGQALEYVKNIRLAETMMGDGVARVQDCEKPMLKYRVMG